MNEKAVCNSAAKNTKKNKKRSSPKKRSESLLLAAESAIDRLKVLSEPGGEVEQMDIKDLKNFISSIKELSAISTELNDGNSSGVVILPEVKIDV